MKNKEVIYSTLNIIEDSLKKEITVEEMSEEFGFSYYYFSRLFKGVTGYSPKDYILKRKLSEAARDITGKKDRIIEIAFDYGFGTPESFTRAFSKMFGMNPSEFRKANRIDESRLLYPATKESIEHRQKNMNYSPEIIKLEKRYLAGLQFYFKINDAKDLTEQWNFMLDNVSSIDSRIKPERYYQMQYWFQNQDIKKSIYFFLAVETENIENLPVQFTGKVLPEQYYVKFIHKGLSGRVGYTYRYIYEEWLPETEYRLPHLFNFEYYGEAYNGPYNEDSESEIYIPVLL